MGFTRRAGFNFVGHLSALSNYLRRPLPRCKFIILEESATVTPPQISHLIFSIPFPLTYLFWSYILRRNFSFVNISLYISRRMTGPGATPSMTLIYLPSFTITTITRNTCLLIINKTAFTPGDAFIVRLYSYYIFV
jgi:hypothetical protein